MGGLQHGLSDPPGYVALTFCSHEKLAGFDVQNDQLALNLERSENFI